MINTLSRIRCAGWAMVLFLTIVLTGCSTEKENASEVVTGTAASADGVPIYYSVQGAGEPALVFVHGWCCDGSYWREQVSHFTRSYQVVAVDLAGHGKSGTGREQWTMPAYGADVAAVVRELDLSPVVLVGHSMGGKVVIEAARLLPGRVIGLIGVDTLQDMVESTFPPERIDAILGQAAQDFPAFTDRFVRGMFPAAADSALVDWVAADMASAPPEIALASMRGLFSHDLKESLAEARLPFRVVNSDRWPINVPGNKSLTVSFEVVVMEDVGHFLHLERPAEFNREFQKVLDEIVDFSAGD